MSWFDILILIYVIWLMQDIADTKLEGQLFFMFPGAYTQWF